MKNFLNTNEVFPILDMINRENRKGKGIITSGIGGYGDSDVDMEYEGDNWQIESFEIIRDGDNPIDNMVITQLVIVYRNGAVDTITLERGANPPVSDNVMDSEYINNLMITEVFIETAMGQVSRWVSAKVIRENGYGSVQRVELEYEDEEVN